MAKLTEQENDSDFETDDEYVTDDEQLLIDNNEEDEEDVIAESILDRLYALTEIIPSSTQQNLLLKIDSIVDVSKSIISFLGSSAWVLTTAAMILILPAALEIEKEHAAVQQEHQQRVQQQQAKEALEVN